MKVWPGRPFPFGAEFDGEGTNVSLFAEHATRVELCLFDDAGAERRVALREVSVQGLRIDHPDGLRDPQGYLDRVRAEVNGTHVVVEKILAPDERLPRTWPVGGTTGYDWLNLATGLFVDATGEEPLTDLYVRFTGDTLSFPEHARRARQQILRDVLAADLERLTALVVDVCERHRRYRDYTRDELRDALRGMLVGLRVYRTYVRPDSVRPEDVARVEEAVQAAAARRPERERDLLDFLRDVLLLRHDGEPERELAARFQQVSAAVMAKGVEDTAFYRYTRLVALNEVGGDPARFGTSVDGMKRLVDACHAHGLAVVLDVVYNHLGPDGNHLGAFGPYFTARYRTPWGAAVNLDGPESDEVREFFLANACMWLRDYHVDGPRLDAVHAIVDTSAVHFLEELACNVGAATVRVPLGDDAGRTVALASDAGCRLAADTLTLPPESVAILA